MLWLRLTHIIYKRGAAIAIWNYSKCTKLSCSCLYFSKIINHSSYLFCISVSRHNERDGVSNHMRLDCLFKRLFQSRSNKTSKLRGTCLCDGNPPVNGGFPTQSDSNVENGSIWWRHHVFIFIRVYSMELGIKLCRFWRIWIKLVDIITNDDVIKWKHLPGYWPFVTRWPMTRPMTRWPMTRPMTWPVTRSFDVYIVEQTVERQVNEPLTCGDRAIPFHHNQYHGWWCPGDMPGHQRPRYWLVFVLKERGFNCLCHVSVEELYKLQIKFYVSAEHYGDVILSTIASQIIRLTIVYSTVYYAQIKENIKSPRHWP